jgi:hypothetical protein
MQQNKLWVSVLSVLVVGGLLLFIIPRAVRERGALESSGVPVTYGASPPSTCRAAALVAKVGRGSAAAGTAYVTLVLISHAKGTDVSTGSCTLSGTPATQFGNVLVTGTGVAEFVGLGPAAKRTTFADRGKTITLKPGAVASVTVGVETTADFAPPSRCHPANVSRVRLIFNNGATFDYALHTTQVCTKLASTSTTGVVLGTRYP